MRQLKFCWLKRTNLREAWIVQCNRGQTPAHASDQIILIGELPGESVCRMFRIQLIEKKKGTYITVTSLHILYLKKVKNFKTLF